MVIIQKDGRILLHRRSQRGLLRGLWEIPGGKREDKEKVMATVNRHLVGLGIKGYGIFKIGEIRHSITRYKIRSPLFVFSDSKSPRFPESSWRWVAIASLHRYPLSSLSLKAVRFFTDLRETRNLR